MTTFSQDKDSTADIDVKDIAGRLLSVPIISSERIAGGLNNRVYRLVGKDASKYILKCYCRDNRLNAEFSSLAFLWHNGLRDIPEPIVVDKQAGCAIYEFIAGEKILSQETTSRDIECAIEFFKRLKGLNHAGATFPSASEAFFSVQDIHGNILKRVNRLKEIKETGEEYEALKDYLDHEFVPFWEILTEWAGKNFVELGMSLADSIPDKDKTLSPSDFGFHNALKDKAGRVVFLDFEHFGWDDPAKMISDFLLHPAMVLDERLKQQFVTGILEVFKECGPLKHRVKILYPIFGLKWCLIFLNEFISEDLRRRDFAQTKTMDKQAMRQEQLSKAKKMLNKIKQTYQKFPYDTIL